MTDKPAILIVDDTPEMVAIVERLLRAQYRTRTATSGNAGAGDGARRDRPTSCCSTS